MVAVSAALLVLETCFIQPISRAEGNGSINILKVITTGSIFYHPAGSFRFIQGFDHQHTTRAGTIQTTSRAFNDLKGVEIVISQLIKVGIATRICNRNIIVINLHVPNTEGRSKRTSSYTETVTARRPLFHTNA